MGTTDTFYPGPDYWPQISREDIEYVKASANSVFNADPVTDDDILGTWSGIRPLLREPGKKPHEISRKHELTSGPGGMISVAGGKLTAYRSMAERVVDQCQETIGHKPAPAATAEEPLPGGDFSEPFNQLRSRVENIGLPSSEANRVAMLYGSEALTLFDRGWGPAVEAEQAVKVEGALTLEDYWVRRSARSNFDDNGGMDALEPAARTMADLLGWSETESERQITRCRERRHQVMSVLNRQHHPRSLRTKTCQITNDGVHGNDHSNH
jgi:glycerol-3-phosphate dehydrogenase